MPKPKKLRFVTELEIVANSKARKDLGARFNAGFRLMNAVQSELLKRKDLVRQSPEWEAAKLLPRHVVDEKGKLKHNPDRTKLYNKAREDALFTKTDAEQYAKHIAESAVWIDEKLDSVVIQTIAERAYKAVDKILFGKAKKVRFKNNRNFSSMQGKQITTSIRILEKKEIFYFVWGKLWCPLIIDWEDPCIAHGMNSDWKFGRIVRREIRGKIRFFLQLICEGLPYRDRKNTQVKTASCSIDLNISAIAMVSHESASLKPFAPNTPKIEKQIKAIQRKQDRSRRINNPDNFYPDDVTYKGKNKGRKVKRKGMIKRGVKLEWRNTRTYDKLGKQRRKLERSKTEYVKSENRRLVNDTLREGGIFVSMEKVSVKGWQKRYGKAIGAKSPGFFQSELIRKAESAGGYAHKYSTQKTACSQTHLNGERHKKKLSERVHRDVTGVVMHRDLFSAYLGLYVNQDGLLMVETASAEYPRIESILQAAWQAYDQSASRLARPVSGIPEVPLELICSEGQNLDQIGNAEKSRVNGVQLTLCLT